MYLLVIQLGEEKENSLKPSFFIVQGTIFFFLGLNEFFLFMSKYKEGFTSLNVGLLINSNVLLQSEPEFRPPMSEIVQKLLRMMPREPINRRPDCDSSNSS